MFHLRYRKRFHPFPLIYSPLGISMNQVGRSKGTARKKSLPPKGKACQKLFSVFSERTRLANGFDRFKNPLLALYGRR